MTLKNQTHSIEKKPKKEQEEDGVLSGIRSGVRRSPDRDMYLECEPYLNFLSKVENAEHNIQLFRTSLDPQKSRKPILDSKSIIVYLETCKEEALLEMALAKTKKAIRKICRDQMQKEIDSIKLKYDTKEDNPVELTWDSGLKWNEEKGQIGLMEIIYALYESECFSGGSMEDIIKSFEIFFHYKVNNHSKTIGNVNRKTNKRFEVLEKMHDALANYFDNPTERRRDREKKEKRRKLKEKK